MLGEVRCNVGRVLSGKARKTSAIGEFGKAIEHLTQALRVNPEYATAKELLKNAYVGRAMAASGTQLPNAALDDYTKAIELSPHTPWLYSQRAGIWAQMNEWGKVVADMKTCLEKDMNNANSWVCYARVALRSGDQQEYRRVCAEMFKRFGHTADIKVAWACTLAPTALPDLKPCVRLARQGVARYPAYVNWQTTLGAILYRSGEFEAADKQLAETASRDGGQTARTRLFQALTAYRLGNVAQAREYLTAAKELGGRLEIGDWWYRAEMEVLFKEAEAALAAGVPPAPSEPPKPGKREK